jgi:hypothetical protein
VAARVTEDDANERTVRWSGLARLAVRSMKHVGMRALCADCVGVAGGRRRRCSYNKQPAAETRRGGQAKFSEGLAGVGCVSYTWNDPQPARVWQGEPEARERSPVPWWAVGGGRQVAAARASVSACSGR